MTLIDQFVVPWQIPENLKGGAMAEYMVLSDREEIVFLGVTDLIEALCRDSGEYEPPEYSSLEEVKTAISARTLKTLYLDLKDDPNDATSKVIDLALEKDVVVRAWIDDELIVVHNIAGNVLLYEVPA